MKKMLMLASVASMIQQFNMRNIHILQEMGYEVHVAYSFLKGSTITKKRTEQLKKELKTIGVQCHQQGGYLCSTKDVSAFADAIIHLSTHEEQRKRMGQVNQQTIQQFSAEIVDEKMKAVYERVQENKDIKVK